MLARGRSVVSRCRSSGGSVSSIALSSREREHCVHDLAHALGVELAEFSINRHAAADVNRSQRWIGHVLFDLFGIVLRLVQQFRSGENFELVGGLVQS